MKTLFAILGILISGIILSQEESTNLISDIEDNNAWEFYNRRPTVLMQKPNNVHSVILDAKQGDGLAIYQNMEFENGTIEVELKGKNVPGQSFVGVAFHIQDEENFNAVYFRPFNFKNEDKVRRGHSVQYISHPEFTWQKLRTDFPEQFENPVDPVPDPDEYFNARIVVSWPDVKVYVEDAEKPSLNVQMKSSFQKGKIGLWVGNGSDGSFKKLIVTSE